MDFLSGRRVISYIYIGLAEMPRKWYRSVLEKDIWHRCCQWFVLPPPTFRSKHSSKRIDGQERGKNSPILPSTTHHHSISSPSSFSGFVQTLPLFPQQSPLNLCQLHSLLRAAHGQETIALRRIPPKRYLLQYSGKHCLAAVRILLPLLHSQSHLLWTPSV